MATYYVDTASTGGDGTTTATTGAQAAFATVAAAQAALTGDQSDNFLLFKKGCVWREMFTVGAYGTSLLPGILDRPFTIGSYGTGDKPIISAGELVTGAWTDGGSNIWTHVCTTEPKVVVFNGTSVKKAVWPPVTDYDWFWSANVLYVHAHSTPATYYTSVQVGARDYAIFNAQKYITFQDIHIELGNSLANIITYHNTVAMDGITVNGCTSKFAAQYGILFFNAHSTYKTTNIAATNNIISWCGASGISMIDGCNFGTITGNEVSYCTWNGVIYNSGIHISGNHNVDMANCTIEYNEVHHCILSTVGEWDTGKGITADECASGGNVIIRYNKVYDNESIGIMTEHMAGTQIYYNLVYGNAKDGITLFRDISAAHVYNNVLYDNDCGIGCRGYAGFTDFDNNLIKNNIAVGNTTRQLVAVIGGDNDVTNGSGNVYLNNCLGVPADSKFVEWGVGVYKDTVSAFDTAYGSATLTVDADPLLVSTVTPDFHLKYNSPCINTGVDVGLTTDYGGFSIVDNPDIGAWEYSGVRYTRHHCATLPTDDADLETYYTSDEVADVAANDTDMVPQSAIDEYAIHQFKVDATGKSSITIEWVGQSNILPSHSTVYMQLYDHTLHNWVVIHSESSELIGINEDFSLITPVSPLEDYKDVNSIITCRVYQEAK